MFGMKIPAENGPGSEKGEIVPMGDESAGTSLVPAIDADGVRAWVLACETVPSLGS